MSEEKGNRKSTRNFNLNKGSSRSFDLEKKEARKFDLDKEDTSGAKTEGHPNKPIPEPIVNGSGESNNSNKKKWIWIILVFIVIIAAILLSVKNCKGKGGKTEIGVPDTTAVSNNDSTKNDSTAIDTTASVQPGKSSDGNVESAPSPKSNEENVQKSPENSPQKGTIAHKSKNGNPSLAKVPNSSESPAGDKIASFGLGVTKCRNTRSLVRLAKKLLNSGGKVAIYGYADKTGSVEINQVVSQRRADAVKAFLVSQGVKESQIQAIGKGVSTKFPTNAQNRRVEAVVE